MATNITSGGLKAVLATQGDSLVRRIFADSAWAARYADAERRGRYQRLAAPVVQTLERRLTALETALSSFRWPVERPWQNARLTLPANQDPSLAGRLSAALPASGDVRPTNRYFSRGFDAQADAGLTQETTFCFTITQAGRSETVSVAARAGDSWGDILEATAQAVNNTTLAVQAEVIEQPVPYRSVPGLGKTGSILALFVDQAHSGQDLDLRNGRGNLLVTLDMEDTGQAALAAALTPAALARHSLTASSRAQATIFRSDAFLPVEAASLDAGQYDLAWSLGGHAGLAPVAVASGMDWEDVLRATALAVNQSTSLVSARVVEARTPTGLTGILDPAYARGLALEVWAAAPKLGERLSLADQGGLVGALGLNATAAPGSDAVLAADGRTMASAGGTFGLDRDRLLVDVLGVTGQPVPLTVTRAMADVETRTGDIVLAYNDLRSFVLANQDLLVPGLADLFRDPVLDRSLDLGWLGMDEITAAKRLAVDRTRFWTALGQDPDRARLVLADAAAGLVPALASAAAEVRSQGPDLLAAPSADLAAPWSREFANDQAQALLGLVDNATESGQAWKRVLDLGGTLLDTIDAKRRA